MQIRIIGLLLLVFIKRSQDHTRSRMHRQLSSRAAWSALRGNERHKRVALMKMKGNTTNVMNRALYVDAYLDAAGSSLVPRGESSGSQTPTSPAVTPHSSTAVVETQIPFGAWRQPSAITAKNIERLNAQRHRMVCGALIPPAFSAVTLQQLAGVATRQLQQQQRSRRAVAALMQFVTVGHQAMKGTRSWSSVESSLSDLIARRYLPDAIKEVQLATRHRVDGGGVDSSSTTPSEALIACVLDECAKAHWRLAIGVFQRVVHSDAVPVGSPAVAAVLLEAVRRVASRQHAHQTSSTVPHDVLLRLVGTMQQRGTHILPPSVAAPLLAAVGGDSVSWQQALSMFVSPCLSPARGGSQTMRQGGQGGHVLQGSGAHRWYLPMIAVGEMLKLVYRCGGTLASVQHLVDVCTDASVCQNAKANMSSHHVFAGYMWGAPWQHTLTMYTEHMPHYGVQRTADVVAAAMHSCRVGGQFLLALRLRREWHEFAESQRLPGGGHAAGVCIEWLDVVSHHVAAIHPCPQPRDVLQAVSNVLVAAGCDQHAVSELLVHPPSDASDDAACASMERSLMRCREAVLNLGLPLSLLYTARRALRATAANRDASASTEAPIDESDARPSLDGADLVVDWMVDVVEPHRVDRAPKKEGIRSHDSPLTSAAQPSVPSVVDADAMSEMLFFS